MNRLHTCGSGEECRLYKSIRLAQLKTINNMNNALTKVNNLIIGVTYCVNCVIDEPLLLNCQTRSSKLIAVNMHVSACKVMPTYYHE